MCIRDSDYDEEFAKRNRDVLEELCKARLAIFKIDVYKRQVLWEW